MLVAGNAAYAANETAGFSEGDSIEFSAKQNEVVTKEVTCLENNTARTAMIDWVVSEISFDLDVLLANEISGIATIVVNEEEQSIPIKGNWYFYPETGGYVGVLEGFVMNPENDNEKTNITFDLNYISSTENFTAVTIGTAGAVKPQIMFFGAITDNICGLINANTLNNYSEREGELQAESENGEVVYPRIDATVRCQGTLTRTDSGYETVTASVYYANELENQNAMPVYAKANSHTASFKEYLINVHGFSDTGLNSLHVYPDTYIVEIIGAAPLLHSDGNIYPTAGSVTQDLNFTAYVPYIEIGWYTIGIPITMSSTSVSYRAMANDASSYPNCIVSWEVYQRYGWNASDIDGYCDSQGGGLVRSYYRYDGDVTSSFPATLGASAQIRYEYVTAVSGASMTLHMWTDIATCGGTVNILP